jgi:hypothetical protein
MIIYIIFQTLNQIDLQFKDLAKEEIFGEKEIIFLLQIIIILIVFLITI